MKHNDVGKFGEDAAAEFLVRNGYKILERNIHISHNELDIIALHKKDGMLIFVEVKTRSVNEDLYSSFGVPSDAVNIQKQRRTIDAAKGYLNSHKKLYNYQPRFDVIEVYLHKETKKLLKINHIENAFGV